jgi:hypothetical protein
MEVLQLAVESQSAQQSGRTFRDLRATCLSVEKAYRLRFALCGWVKRYADNFLLIPIVRSTHVQSRAEL